jgi:hypothetical protein
MARNRRGFNARIASQGFHQLGAGVSARIATGALVEPSPANELVLDAMPEKELQRHIRTALEDRGWIVTVIPDMRLVLAGWPDLCDALPGGEGW